MKRIIPSIAHEATENHSSSFVVSCEVIQAIEGGYNHENRRVLENKPE